MARECHGGCGRDPELDWDDPDARYCRMCWAEEQEWRAQCAYDAKGKEINRGEDA